MLNPGVPHTINADFQAADHAKCAAVAEPLRVWFSATPAIRAVAPADRTAAFTPVLFARTGASKTAFVTCRFASRDSGGTVRTSTQNCPSGTLISRQSDAPTYSGVAFWVNSATDRTPRWGARLDIWATGGPDASTVTATTPRLSGHVGGHEPPKNITATYHGDRIELAWEPPDGVGHRTAQTNGYTVAWRELGGHAWTTAAPSPWQSEAHRRGYTIRGLDHSTTYEILVSTRNDAADRNNATHWHGFGEYLTATTLCDTPAAPTLTGGSQQPGQFTQNWSAPAGGSCRITGYDLEYRNTGSTTWTRVQKTAEATSHTQTGVAAGNYIVRVRAHNSDNHSDWAAISQPITIAAEGLRAWWEGDGQPVIGVSDGYRIFNRLSTNKPAAGMFQVEGVSQTWSDSRNSPPDTLINFHSRGNTHTGGTGSTDPAVALCGRTVRVRFTATSGDETVTGEWRQGTICGPKYPSQVRTVAGSTAVTLAWAPGHAGANNAAINGYDVYRRAVGATDWVKHNATPLSAATRFVRMTGLTAGTAYEVQIFARNDGGSGSGYWSFPYRVTSGAVASSGTAPGGPAASVTAGNTQLALSWTAPTATGGSDIIAYQIRHKVSSAGDSTYQTSTVLGTAASHTIGGLVNGTSYTVQIRAVNGTGESSWATIGTTHTPTAG